MPQRDLQKSEGENPSAAWEQKPWLAKDVVLEDPPREAGLPLLLCDEHVIDVPLDGDSIRRV